MSAPRGERRFGCTLCATLPPPGYLDRLAAKSIKNEKHSVEGHVRHHHPDRLEDWQRLAIELPRFRRAKSASVAQQPARQDAITPYAAAIPGAASAFITLKYRTTTQSIAASSSNVTGAVNNKNHDIVTVTPIQDSKSRGLKAETETDNDGSPYDISIASDRTPTNTSVPSGPAPLNTTTGRRQSARLSTRPRRLKLICRNPNTPILEKPKDQAMTQLPSTGHEIKRERAQTPTPAKPLLKLKKILILKMDDFDWRVANGELGHEAQDLMRSLFPLPAESTSTMLYTGAIQAGVEGVKYLQYKAVECPARRKELFDLGEAIRDLET